MSQSREHSTDGEIVSRLERTLQGEVPDEISERLRGRMETFARAAAETGSSKTGVSERSGRPSSGDARRRPMPFLKPALAAMGLVALVLLAVALRRPVLEYWYMGKLDAEDEAVRQAAAEKLGSMRSVRAVPRLISLLREASAAQMPQIGQISQSGLTVLTGLTDLTSLSSRPGQGRWNWTGPQLALAQDLHYSARALIAIGPPAVPELVEFLQEPNRGAGYPTARVLAAIGPTARDPLLELLAGTEPHVRSLAAAAVGVRGRVVDHRGEPVAAARVYLASSEKWQVDDENAFVPRQQQQVRLRRGTTVLGTTVLSRQTLTVGFVQPEDPTIRTDDEGRFVLYGATPENNRVLVMTEGLHVWVAPAPDIREDVTIELPEPAVVVIHYEPGTGSEKSRFELKLSARRNGLWDKSVRSLTRRVPGDRSGQVSLEGLTPGRYKFRYAKTVDFRPSGPSLESWLPITGKPSGITAVTLNPGEITIVDLRLEDGVAVSGQVTGLDENAALSVSIQLVAFPGWTPMDLTGRVGNGRFNLAALAPGTYMLRAEAYEVRIQSTSRRSSRSRTPIRVTTSGRWAPTFTCETTLTVPPKGEPIEVELELEPVPIPPTPTPRASSSSRTGRSSGGSGSSSGATRRR